MDGPAQPLRHTGHPDDPMTILVKPSPRLQKPPFSLSPPSVDAAGLAERVGVFTRRSIKNESKAAGLRLAVAMMDLTTLEGADTEGKVQPLSLKTIRSCRRKESGKREGGGG